MRSISTWLDAYLELRHRAFIDRGWIELSDGARWPRTTGEQVAAIAATFTPAIVAHGDPRVVSRWRATVADVQRDALSDLARTYVHNREFWVALEDAAKYLDAQALKPPPTRAWTALFALVDAAGAVLPRNIGPSGDGPFKHFDGVQTFDDLYNAQSKYLRDLRGFDKMAPVAGTTGVQRLIPRATNGDVVLLADYWTKQLAHVRDIPGTDRVTAGWRAAMADVDKLARRANANGLYPKNNAFWRALSTTAIHVAVADEERSRWDLAKAAIKDSIVHLPSTLGTAASKGVEAIVDVAGTAGRVVNAAGKGLLAGAGTPVLVGIGVVGGLLLLRGARRHDEA